MARESQFPQPNSTTLEQSEGKDKNRVYGYDVVKLLNTDQDGKKSILGQIVEAAETEQEKSLLQDARFALRRGEVIRRVYLRIPSNPVSMVEFLEELTEVVMKEQRGEDTSRLTEQGRELLLKYATRVFNGRQLKFHLRELAWPEQEASLQIPGPKNRPEFWDSGKPKIESQNVRVPISNRPILRKITLVDE